MTSRRDTLLAGCTLALLLAAPLPSDAQRMGKVWRIAWLGEGADPGAANVAIRPFVEGLRDLSYIEGQHFTLDRRFAGGSPKRLRELAAELVALKVDLIAAPGTQALLALKAAISTIPIVMVYPGDPVGNGIVNSLSRPGGNITGTSLMALDVSGKRLQILKEIVPTLRRVGVIWNPNNAASASVWRSTEQMARSLGLQIEPLPVDGSARLKEALNEWPGSSRRESSPFKTR